MGYTIGLPLIKLSVDGKEGKHTGNLHKIIFEALEERQGRDEDIDHSRSYLNINLGRVKNGELTDDFTEMYSKGADLEEYCLNRLKNDRITITSKNKKPYQRKLKKNSVMLLNMVIKPSWEFMDTMTEVERIEFLKTSYLAFAEYVGEDNIKAAVIHMEEKNPHLHLFWEPNVNGQLYCDAVVTPKYLRNLGKDIPKYLRQHGYEMIDDCESYKSEEELALMSKKDRAAYKKERKEKRKHYGQDSRTYKSRMERDKKQLAEDIEGLIAEREQAEYELTAVNLKVRIKNKEAAKIKTEAQEEADGIKAAAQAQANEIIAAAQVQKERLEAEANEYYSDRIKSAKDDNDKLKAENEDLRAKITKNQDICDKLGEMTSIYEQFKDNYQVDDMTEVERMRNYMSGMPLKTGKTVLERYDELVKNQKEEARSKYNRFKGLVSDVSSRRPQKQSDDEYSR